MTQDQARNLMFSMEDRWKKSNNVGVLEWNRIMLRDKTPKNWRYGKITHVKMGTKPALVILYNAPVTGGFCVCLYNLGSRGLCVARVDQVTDSIIFLSF